MRVKMTKKTSNQVTCSASTQVFLTIKVSDFQQRSICTLTSKARPQGAVHWEKGLVGQSRGREKAGRHKVHLELSFSLQGAALRPTACSSLRCTDCSRGWGLQGENWAGGCTLRLQRIQPRCDSLWPTFRLDHPDTLPAQ